MTMFLPEAKEVFFMSRSIAAGLLALSFLLGAGGCATPPPARSRTVDVYLDGKGFAQALDERAPQSELPRLLIRERVPRESIIAVHVPDTRDQATISMLTAELAKAGFRRITFIGVRHADASVR
jgi:hypothetical protein